MNNNQVSLVPTLPWPSDSNEEQHYLFWSICSYAFAFDRLRELRRPFCRILRQPSAPIRRFAIARLTERAQRTAPTRQSRAPADVGSRRLGRTMGPVSTRSLEPPAPEIRATARKARCGSTWTFCTPRLAAHLWLIKLFTNLRTCCEAKDRYRTCG